MGQGVLCVWVAIPVAVVAVLLAMTVEPGIYVAPNNKKVAKKWRGIGIRIEDDVVVTAEGCEVLTNGVPKTVVEIEALMAASTR